ncbi:MAG: hypothetical protein PWP23_3028 [Candidatus Sumerlaeota bacterium]|nr:hypothetical protein [Candidatus Sumerlaeota bacterium]
MPIPDTTSPSQSGARKTVSLVLCAMWAVLALISSVLSLAAIARHGTRIETMVFLNPALDGGELINLAVAGISETLKPLLLSFVGWLLLQVSGRHWLKSLCTALALSFPILALLFSVTLFLPTFEILLFDDYRTLMEPMLRNPRSSVALGLLVLSIPLFVLVGLTDMVVAYIVGLRHSVPDTGGEPALGEVPAGHRSPNTPLLLAAVAIVAVVGICLASVASFAIGSRGSRAAPTAEKRDEALVLEVVEPTNSRALSERIEAERKADARRAAEEQARREAEERARKEAAERARKEAEQRARAKAWNDVTRYVQTVGTGLHNEIVSVPELEYFDVYSRDSARLRTLGSFSFEDMDLESLRILSSLELGSSLALLNRIGEVQGNRPSEDEMVFSSLNALAEGFQNRGSQYKEFDDTLGAFHTLTRSIQAESRLEELQDQYRDQDWKTRWVILDGIKPLAARFAGNSSLSSFGISYLPSWYGAYPQDIVGMTNNTGTTLTNAVVYVSVSNDEYRTDHVHFVPSWPAGATRYAAYRYWVDDYQSSMTRSNVNSVIVKVHTATHSGTFSRELSQSDIDAVIEEYCKKLKFKGGYLPPSQSFWTGNQPKGVSFNFSGLSRLPVTRVDVDFQAVDFQSGSRTSGVYWDYSNKPSLRSGKSYEFRSSSFDFSPQQWAVTLAFKGTTYKHVITWSR